jgi:threonine synthase
MLISPGAAVTWKALLHLRRMGIADNRDKIVMLNTGSGYKYLENIV